MAQDKFFIAPLATGLQTDLPPWMIMDDAFSSLQNAYIFRGRLRKRFGSAYMGNPPNQFNSRFKYNVGTTDPSTGNLSGNVGAAINAAQNLAIFSNVGLSFSVGTQLFTVTTTGSAAMLTNGVGTGTYNTANGDFSIVGAALNTPVYYYPSSPVMGLTVYEVGPTNNQQTFGFDQQFNYIFDGNQWSQSPTTPTWQGTDYKFFWSANWYNLTINQVLLFVSNFNVVNQNGPGSVFDDPIYYYDGNNTLSPMGWATKKFIFIPDSSLPAQGQYVATALLIFPFHDRLVLFSTIENNGTSNFGNNTAYYQRARWSAAASPLEANAWYERGQVDSAGRTFIGGGFLDATTQEKIISAEYVKDQLIVYFEKSTWAFVWTGNQILPFTWQKINTELGSQSTFSVVPFDKFALAIGNTGVHSCNGANVERIDEKIPQFIFQIQGQPTQIPRIAGIRDYFVELIYWCFPKDGQNTITQLYPTQVLVYNYVNKSWALFDDSITTFGYFEQQIGLTWANAVFQWQSSNKSWSEGISVTNFRQVIAGNQEGYVFIINPDISVNAYVLQITNITLNGINGKPQFTVINHNLATNSYIAYQNTNGVTWSTPPGSPASFSPLADSITVVDVNNFYLNNNTYTGAYTGGGTVSTISNYNIVSKQWNPYKKQDRNVHLEKIDFIVNSTTGGGVTVDYSPSSSNLNIIQDGAPENNAIQGNNTLDTYPYTDYYPLEARQDRLWHPVYFEGEGAAVNLFIYMTDAQMRDQLVPYEDFQIEGMVLNTSPTSNRLF